MSEPLPTAEPPSRTASIMNRIVSASLLQPFHVSLMTLVLTGAGARSLQRLPVDA
jgi:cobalt-zinc-cadmium resistance protein CzcA